MGLFGTMRDQFLDVIEYEDKSNKLIVSKFQREWRQRAEILLKGEQPYCKETCRNSTVNGLLRLKGKKFIHIAIEDITTGT